MDMLKDLPLKKWFWGLKKRVKEEKAALIKI